MTEHLNVGDVTGPRWVGGTRNPDDAAWHDYVLLSPGAKVSWRDTFMAGRASRDAEVGVLREQLAAAEAVLEKVREQNTLPNGRPRYRELAEILESEPTWKGCKIPPDGWWCSRETGHEGPCAARPGTPPNPGERAAALRSGTEGSTDDES